MSRFLAAPLLAAALVATTPTLLHAQRCAACLGVPFPGVAQPVTTTYTSGLAIRSLRYGKKPEVGPLKGNTSGLVVGDTILEADGAKTTSDKVLGDAITKATQEKRAVRLVVLDARSRQPFILPLDFSDNQEMVRETEVVPVNLTVSSYYLSRP